MGIIQTTTLTRTQQREAFNEYGRQVAMAMESYDVPDDKMEQVVDFAIGTLAKNPNMKPARIVRKTVEQFRLKKRPAKTEI